MADRIRQVSRPVHNKADGRWYNRERVLEPDGQGSYFVRDETMYRSHDGESSTGLPEPWQENVSSYLYSLIPPVLLSPSPRGKLVAAGQLVSTLGAMVRNENPLSGTTYDVPYNTWRGTDEPWNYSRLHPFDLDYDPQIVPDGYSTSVRRGRTVAE